MYTRGQWLFIETSIAGDKVGVAVGYRKVAAAVADLGSHGQRGRQIARRVVAPLADKHAACSSAL